MKKPSLTENILFNGKDTVTINAEIPEDLWNNIAKAHDDEIKNGNSSLTIEQFSGGFIQLVYNWTLYLALKSVYGK